MYLSSLIEDRQIFFCRPAIHMVLVHVYYLGIADQLS